MSFLKLIACFLFVSICTSGCHRVTKTEPEETGRVDAPDQIADNVSVVAGFSKPKTHDSVPTLFQRLGPVETGIDFTIRWDKPAKFDRVFYSQNTGGGVCIADVDNDGLPDVYLTRPSGGNRLYRNQGDLKFEDVTDKAGLRDDNYWGTGASFVDIDNDGDHDLYTCSYSGTNRLYLNRGDGTFEQTEDALGLGFQGASVMMAFADYDRDGDLDGYLVTAGLPPGNKKFRVKFVGKKPVVRDELREYWDLLYLPGDKAKQIEAGQYDRLYRNDPGPDGKPRFTNVADSSGIVGTDIGQSATWWDYNNDAWPDLYVANDYWGADRLYKNNGDGTFTDVAKTALPHTPWSSMGADVGDINQDGLLDLLATDMAGSNHFRQKVGMGDMANAGWFLEFAEPRQYSRNALYVNTGTERFMEAAFLTDLDSSDWTWTPRIEDFDNDGLADVFITNGMTREFTNSDLNDLAKQTAKEGSPEFFAFWRKQGFRKDPNVIYRNQGDLRFENKSRDWGFDRVGVSFGAATADLDLDGDLDIVVNNMDIPAQVYRNQTRDRANSATNGSNSLRLKLVGTKSNRSALGALVTVEAGERKQVRYLTMSRGWTSTSEPILHFGLGAHAKAKVSVRWPNADVQQIGELLANQTYQITESDDGAVSETSDEPTMFAASITVANQDVVHSEPQFDDFRIQPLLPNKLSSLGPGMACADINGDGFDDYYLGGGNDQAGTLLLSSALGLERKPIASFDADKQYEDMGALFFDADRDGDHDLYVVSGGANRPQGNSLLQDRLYINENGDFVRSTDRLPNVAYSGSVVAGSDFDRDGDIDLFVGTRVNPGRYPTAPVSQLLRNEGGKFVDVTDRQGPELQKAGMVTSACWSDYDCDYYPDLLVTYEWGPVRCFRNEQGAIPTLRDVTDEVGLKSFSGWWNGIACGDVDNNGCPDFIVTNFGLNTKYHASDEHPSRIYYGDYDGSGRKRIVEAEYEGEKLFPVRGKSCSTNAIPILGKRFKTYSDFGVAELNEIYTTSCLQSAEKFEVNVLEHALLRTVAANGRVTFKFEPLPRITQVAPAFGAVLEDLNHDGFDDVFLAQNFYSPQRETGHMDGGVSMVLLGKGDGTWSPLWPNRSGIAIGADAMGAIASDVNHDGTTDLMVSVNMGQFRGFESGPAPQQKKIVRVRLAGPAGNPDGWGTRVCLLGHNDHVLNSRQVHANSGYLTQESAEVVFAVPREQETVRFSTIPLRGEGKTHEVKLEGSVTRVRLTLAK